MLKLRRRAKPITNPIDVLIGQAVTERRFATKRSIQELAAAIGISASAYVAREAGETAFQARDLFVLADRFGVPLRDLMPDNEALRHVPGAERYGDAEEVRDLIHFFSGIVSPALRKFFIDEIKDASIQPSTDTAPEERAPSAVPATDDEKAAA